MGWTLQGYNSQGFNPSLGIKSDYWYVECNGEENNEIEKYHDLEVDIGTWNQKIKIVYGTSGSEYFRGYVLTNDMELANSLLNQFNTFLVYKNKYGGKKEFNTKIVTFISFLEIIFFFENNPKNRLDELISSEKIKEELFNELSFGIKYNFIDNCGKSLEEINHELWEKILFIMNK